MYVSPELLLSTDISLHDRVSPVEELSIIGVSDQVLEYRVVVSPVHVVSVVVHESVVHVHASIVPHELDVSSPLQLDISDPEYVGRVSPLEDAVSPVPVSVGSVDHVLVDVLAPVHSVTTGGAIISW